MIDQFVWLFLFCILDGVSCDIETKPMLDYQSCIEAQKQYAIDHVDEDYLSICKARREIQA